MGKEETWKSRFHQSSWGDAGELVYGEQEEDRIPRKSRWKYEIREKCKTATFREVRREHGNGDDEQKLSGGNGASGGIGRGWTE
jgi:hypothetical protein